MAEREAGGQNRSRTRLRSRGRWILANLLPGCLSTLVVLGIIIAAGEIALRRGVPFNQIAWPTQFDPRYGWNFVPGATVQWTNHVDNWTTTRVNSIGFLDREPPVAGVHPGACRVAFIGDSFLVAPQVPLTAKFPTVFERLANTRLSGRRNIQTFGLSFDGTGQSNQLPFYDVFARPLQPDVVVLVFVANDFANNSTWLESIRNGWSPQHPPRLFFEPGTLPGTFTTVPIDPLWVNYLLPAGPDAGGHPSRLITYLSDHSYLYDWAYAGFLSHSDNVSAWLMGGPPPWVSVYHYREMELERMFGNSSIFGDWNPEKMDMDSIFRQSDIPPVFIDALLSTGHALDEFKLRSLRDGFHLVIFSTSSMTSAGQGRIAFQRLQKLAADRGIDLVAQTDYITAIGHDVLDASFTRDAHWNEQGHRWAAEALLQYFQLHPELCV